MAGATKRSPFQYVKVRALNISSADGFERFDNDFRPSNRSWRAVTTMLTALLLGALFATSQHIMNEYFNERDVSSVIVSSRWISRMNTALAFLVKTCLVVTIGVAFIQRQWLKMHAESQRVEEIDALTGVLGNIFNFFRTTVWFHHPILMLMALCAWAIPIASIITPGSISIEQRPQTNTTNLQVPQHDWAGTGYPGLPCCGAFGTVFAEPKTYKIAFTSGMSANSLSLPSQYSNQSYHLTFYGPAVQCVVVKNSDIYAASLGLRPYGSAPTESTSTYASLDQLSMDASRIFMMVQVMTSPYGVLVTECVLHNATYDVDFVFTNSEQQHNILSVQLLNKVAANSFIDPESGGVNATGYTIASYAGVMDAFGRLLAGSFSSDQYSANTTIQTSYNLLSIDWNDANSTYEGLESLFHNITLSFLSDNTFT